MSLPLPSDALKKYREEIDTCTPLTEEETRHLFRTLRATAHIKEKQTIIHKLSEAYLTFVVDVAESFTSIELILVDYIQEGNIALLQAIEEYDPTKEQTFLEYCTPRIYRAIQEYITEHPTYEPTPETETLEDEEE